VRNTAGVMILVGLVPLVWYLLQQGGSTETLFKLGGLALGLTLLWLTLKHRDARERNNMWAYLILGLGSLVFWALYQMAPNGLQLFAVHNVDLYVWGVQVAPQWIQNINTVVIVLGGPAMAALFARLRARGWRIDIPQQFAIALLLMGAAFLVLPVGISLADELGKVAFAWLFLSYVLQSVGELFISPIGYAMIGKLAPRQYQGVMMGSWMLVTGLASLYAGDFSGMIPEPSGTTAIASNPEYASLFARLGWGATIVGVVLVLLIPFLRRLIKDRETPDVEDPVAAVPAR
jgi:POT family proton-dependent oligopeptide transporter